MTLIAALKKFWKDNNLPGGPQIETDNYGQILIYTGMVEKEDGSFREVTDEDMSDEET